MTTLAKAKNNELHINLSNQLVRMAHGLSLPEKRVVSLCMAQLDSLRIYDGRAFKITAQDYGIMFGVSEQAAYVQLKEAADKLLLRVAQEVIGSRSKPIVRKWPWVGVTEYHEGQGFITLAFNPQMTPHLFLLRKGFTSYQLKQAVALRSLYSWRLLELLMQWKSTGLLVLSVDDFCHALDVPPTARNNFGQLRLRVIEPAVRELCAKDGWLIEWRGTKAGGRKVTGLEFKFAKDPQGRLV